MVSLLGCHWISTALRLFCKGYRLESHWISNWAVWESPTSPSFESKSLGSGLVFAKPAFGRPSFQYRPPLSGSGVSPGALLVFVKRLPSAGLLYEYKTCLVSGSSFWARRAVLRNERHAWCLHPLPGSGVASGARLVFVKPAFGRLPF